MGWVRFIVAMARLMSLIWVSNGKGKLTQAKAIANALFLSKPHEAQKHGESLCPLGDCFREKLKTNA